jgi:hypothetical protein
MLRLLISILDASKPEPNLAVSAWSVEEETDLVIAVTILSFRRKLQVWRKGSVKENDALQGRIRDGGLKFSHFNNPQAVLSLKYYYLER